MFWTGLFLAIVGLWVLLRTIRKDAEGFTLVDRITGGAA